eukprot:114420-Amphidinium_carterae.4
MQSRPRMQPHHAGALPQVQRRLLADYEEPAPVPVPEPVGAGCGMCVRTCSEALGTLKTFQESPSLSHHCCHDALVPHATTKALRHTVRGYVRAISAYVVWTSLERVQQLYRAAARQNPQVRFLVIGSPHQNWIIGRSNTCQATGRHESHKQRLVATH